ncbi:MAG: hypothetical protein HYX87_02560 [Chloroflexi bacterium]|nr:hypothetical protein [Chloroflexota bacterium]
MDTERLEALRQGSMLPSFDLPEADGGRVKAWDYRSRRNLVVLLVHGPNCPICLDAAGVSGKDRATSGADVVAWLRFIQAQCPECGVPEWPR